MQHLWNTNTNTNAYTITNTKISANISTNKSKHENSPPWKRYLKLYNLGEKQGKSAACHFNQWYPVKQAIPGKEGSSEGTSNCVDCPCPPREMF